MVSQEFSFDSIAFNSSVSIRFRETLAQLQGSKTERLLTRQLAQSKAKSWQVYWLAAMITIIVAVSVYDVYWSFKTAAILHETEQNPIGTWLINLDGGDISLFMTAKMVGTMLVILSIPAIFYHNRVYGLICAAGITVFQCLLMVYFEFGHLIFS